jgi:tRNA(Ile)-lysidine synthase
LKEIEFKHVDLLLGEMGHEGSGPIDLPGGIVVLNEYGNLTITLREELDPKYRCQSLKVELTIPGVTNVPDLGINIIARLEDADKVDVGSNNKKEKAYLDFKKIALPLWVRTRSPGDRFVPLGMSHRKKIQDFFVDNKIPKRKRDRIPIIESQGQIVWIGKIAIDDRVKVTGSTEKVLVLEVK